MANRKDKPHPAALVNDRAYTKQFGTRIEIDCTTQDEAGELMSWLTQGRDNNPLEGLDYIEIAESISCATVFDGKEIIIHLGRDQYGDLKWEITFKRGDTVRTIVLSQEAALSLAEMIPHLRFAYRTIETNERLESHNGAD